MRTRLLPLTLAFPILVFGQTSESSAFNVLYAFKARGGTPTALVEVTPGIFLGPQPQAVSLSADGTTALLEVGHVTTPVTTVMPVRLGCGRVPTTHGPRHPACCAPRRPAEPSQCNKAIQLHLPRMARWP
jgi:hypothetical protein